MEQALGEATYASLAKGERQQSNQEFSLMVPCIRQFGLPEGLSSWQGGPPLYIAMLTGDDLARIVTELASPGWLQSQTESVIDQVFASLLDNRMNAPTLTISLAELKTSLRGETGQRILAIVFEAQPPCNSQQLAEITAPNPPDPAERMIVCNLPEAQRALAGPYFHSIIDELSVRIPERAYPRLPWNFVSPTGSQEKVGFFDNPRLGIQTLRLGLLLSPLIPLALLGLAGLLAVRTRKSWLRWWGIPLLLAGLLGTGVALASLPALNWAVQQVASKTGGSYTAFSPVIIQVGFDAVRTVVRQVAVWMGLEAGLIALVGAGMLLISTRATSYPSIAVTAALKAD